MSEDDQIEHPFGQMDEIRMFSGVDDVSFLTGDYTDDCVKLLSEIKRLRKSMSDIVENENMSSKEIIEYVNKTLEKKL